MAKSDNFTEIPLIDTDTGTGKTLTGQTEEEPQKPESGICRYLVDWARYWRTWVGAMCC